MLPDLRSLAEVVAEARPILAKIAARLCASKVDADDLVQDTIVRALNAKPGTEITNPLAWLTTLMQNLFIDRHRKQARTPQHDSLDDYCDLPDNVTPIDGDVLPPWEWLSIDDVWRALREVGEPFREVFILHCFDHRTYESIADEMKISTVTVGTRLSRVRERLRKILLRRGVERKP